MALVETDINDYLGRISEGVYAGYSGDYGSSLYAETLIDSLSSLDWNAPTYDDEKPSYNLSFTATKTADTLAGKLSIKHAVTGEYAEGVDQWDVRNGTLSNTISASYGSADKWTYSNKNNIQSKFNKDDELISRTTAGSSNESIVSTNGTDDDKSDDFSYKYNDSYSSNWKYDINSQLYDPADYYIGFTGTSNSKHNAVYKSKYLNFSSSGEDSEVYTLGDSEIKTESGKYASTYANTNVDEGVSITYTLKGAYKITFDYAEAKELQSNEDITATFKATSNDDPSSSFALDFTGNISSGYDAKLEANYATATFKSLSIKTADVESTSNAFDITLDDESYSNLEETYINNSWVLENPRNGAMDGEYNIPELVQGMKDVFTLLNKGDQTIAIKNADGYEVDAGAGNDTVTGGAGDDTIISGSGSDQLTGGKGGDTFVFNLSDYINDEGVYNKSVDTISDFNVNEDMLDLSDIGSLEFFANLAEAKSAESYLFYTQGKIYLDVGDGAYKPVNIINLVGSPKADIDAQDWVYAT